MVGVAVDWLSCPLADEDILFTAEASSKTNSLVACVSSLSVGLHYVYLAFSIYLKIAQSLLFLGIVWSAFDSLVSIDTTVSGCPIDCKVYVHSCLHLPRKCSTKFPTTPCLTYTHS